jgi:hypothetical protein
MPYQGRGLTPLAPTSAGPRQLNGASHRMPYHSPHGGDHRGDGDHRGGWDHRGRDRDHDHDRDHDRDLRFVFLNFGLAGYPYWPWWGWGYPYLNGFWNDDFDSYDAQPASNYAASQYPEYAPSQYQGQYEDPQPEQAEPERPSYTPRPSSQPAPSASEPAPAAAAEVPATTLVFKDGRPNQQIHNYLLTATTLSVLDRNRRDIPVDQIDLAATEKANRATGVEFSLPGGGR